MTYDTALALWPDALSTDQQPCAPCSEPPANKDLVLWPYPVDEFRPQERAILRALVREGRLAVAQLHKCCPGPKAVRVDALYDLHRMGLIEVFVADGPKGKCHMVANITPGVTLPSLIEP